MTLTDIHELMEIALLNSYFVYDRQVYIQLLGFFMGVRPAPLGAIIKMWYLERNSIYTDLRLGWVFYGRFYDDLGSIVTNKRKAELCCSMIETADPDKRIRLTVDFPEKADDFVPFLNAEVRISREGDIETRLYRKPQKKLLTLNQNSHHPTSVKEHTVVNMYKTAESIASNTENKKYSERMVDELLINNGYKEKTLQRIKQQQDQKKLRRKKKQRDDEKRAVLKIPFLSDKCTSRIKQAAIKHNIPVRVVTTPGMKLKNMLTSSKPLDQPRCPNNDCNTCSNLKSKGQCTDQNLVYHMNCEMSPCKTSNMGHYDGETLRSLDERYTEHYRSAKNPTAKSYEDKPWAKHYAEKHPNCDKPKIGVSIVERARSTNERKIKEARTIISNKSDLNDRNEHVDLKKFLV